MVNPSKKKDPRSWEKWRNAGAVSTRNFNQQQHPEIRPGEVWLGNINEGRFDGIGWKSKRSGCIALDYLGRPISQHSWLGEFFPVFAKKEELSAAGVEIKYKPEMVRYFKPL